MQKHALELEFGFRSLSLSSAKDPNLSRFLNDRTLPFVLQFLRGCVWTGPSPPAPPFPPPPPSTTSTPTSTRQLLAFLHKLETSKSVGRIGLLAEDLLDEWVSVVVAKADEPEEVGSVSAVVNTVRELRKLTVQRNRRIAREVRQRQLLSLNMKVNEKGQVRGSCCYFC